jgi:hypothetical protein
MEHRAQVSPVFNIIDSGYSFFVERVFFNGERQAFVYDRLPQKDVYGGGHVHAEV